MTLEELKEKLINNSDVIWEGGGWREDLLKLAGIVPGFEPDSISEIESTSSSFNIAWPKGFTRSKQNKYITGNFEVGYNQRTWLWLRAYDDCGTGWYWREAGEVDTPDTKATRYFCMALHTLLENEYKDLARHARVGTYQGYGAVQVNCDISFDHTQASRVLGFLYRLSETLQKMSKTSVVEI